MTRLRHGESPPGGEGVAVPVRVARKVFDLALVRDAINIMSCFFEIKKKKLTSHHFVQLLVLTDSPSIGCQRRTRARTSHWATPARAS